MTRRLSQLNVIHSVTVFCFFATTSIASAQAPSTPIPSEEASAAPPVNTGSEIVVIGRDIPDIETVQKSTRAITSVEAYDRPIARFATPVCIAAHGLPRKLLANIADRMLADATEAGIRLAGDNCKANVAILFVNDGRAELKLLQVKRPDLFGAMMPAEARRILAEPGPDHVLANTAISGTDGDPSDIDPITGLRRIRSAHASRIALPVRRDMLSVVLMIDRSAIAGLTVQQIADYAAMRAFAMVRPDGAAGVDTILTLFRPNLGQRLTEMSSFDRSYLKALYVGSGNQYPLTKIGSIARAIDRDARGEGK